MTAIPIPAARTRRATRWTARVLTALPVLFLIMDATIKLVRRPEVAESMNRLGWSTEIAVPIGALELVLIALYLVPRTALVGAVLLTGFLGGAVATHVRVDDPLLTHVLFPTYVAALLWAGLFLRDTRLRQLLAR